MNKFQNFKNLHQQVSPLQIGNVWDCQSALMFEKLGYQVIGTSSAAIASSLGYDDGEQMDFKELNAIVQLILSKVSIPLTVDLEGGYSRNLDQIINHITILYQAGVVGINLEDSIVDNGRKILEAQEFSEMIKKIKSCLETNNIDIFLNIRTDLYIMGLDNPLEETVSRVKLYEKAGADGIFIPCMTDENDITKVVEAISLPINVMTMPNLPSFEILKKCGVKRISMGPFIYNNMVSQLQDTLNDIGKNQSFNDLFK